MNDLLTPHDDNEELEQSLMINRLRMKASFKFFASQCHNVMMSMDMDMEMYITVHSPWPDGHAGQDKTILAT